jgi:hypothetical protein
MFDASVLAPSSPTMPTSVIVAVLSAYVMHLLKAAKSLPKINFYTTKLNFGLRAAMSAIGTIGISLKWAAATAGGGTVVIAIPGAMVLLSGLWHWAGQFGVQHGFESVFQIARQLSEVATQSAAGETSGATK